MRAKIMVLRHVINRRGKIKLYRKLAFLIRKNWTLSIPQWSRFIFIKNRAQREIRNFIVNNIENLLEIFRFFPLYGTLLLLRATGRKKNYNYQLL